MNLKKFFFSFFSILSIIGYGVFVFAAPPGVGGYNPGEILDPECAPGDVDCVVKLQISGGGSPAGSDTQIQYNNAGAFGADAGFFKTDETFGLGLLQGQQSAVTFTGSGLDDLTVGTEDYGYTVFNGTYPTTYTVTIDGVNVDMIVIESSTITGGVFAVGNTITNGLGGTATVNSVVEAQQFGAPAATYLGVTITAGTFGNGETIDNGSGVTGTGYYSVSDTLTYTDGTTTISNIPTFSGMVLTNDVVIIFSASTGHTIADSWTWTYSNVQNNILDFSNGTYKFGTDFGTDYFGYEVGNNLLGFGLNGSANTYTNVAGDFGFSGILNTGELVIGNSIQLATGEMADSSLRATGYDLSIRDALGIETLLNLTSNQFSIINDNSTNQNGIEFNTIGTGLLRLGNLSGGNGTSITIDDIAQTINFNNNYSFPFADGAAGQVLGTDGSGQLGWVTVSGGSVSPISIGTSGNTLYSSGLSGTGQGDTSTGNNIFLGINAGNGATSASGSNFLGSSAGYSATSASNSNFLGLNAGQYATDASNSNFLGPNAGNGATSASGSNFLGSYAGNSATGAYNSNFLGLSAGNSATGAYHSNFLGQSAGNSATGAYGSNFFGSSAGQNATDASSSNFLGPNAGINATNASNSNFLGNQAGSGATNAFFSNFLGLNAGKYATDASNSNFLGPNAGNGATGASNSIFIGKSAGNSDLVNNTGSPDDFSILIGPNTSTGNNGSGVGYSNSIALGGYATNTASNQFMIGSSTRPINQIVMVASGGTTCATDINGTACSSDERLKTNITDLTTGILDKVVNTKTVTFNWNNNTDTTSHIGFIAQDIQQYFPELVSTGSTGYLSVNYAGMTPVLVQAIREMNLHITELANMERPNTWRDSFIAWFGNIENGITELFVGKLRAHELCLDDVCVTKDQLQQMMQQNNIQTIITPPTDTSTGTDPAGGEPAPVSTDTLTDTSTISDPITPTENTEPTPVAPDVSTEQPSA